MITFILSIALLIVAYFTYGKFVERFFGASSKIETPVKRLADGVDYHELKPWRIFVIQFLNIAGLGPIFGAIMGAAYGPMAYLWIVVGCIFMGATHDYFSGMLSIRNDGMSLPDIVGKYLGTGVRKFMTIFTGFLLLAVGVSFVNGPAELLANLTGNPPAHRQNHRQNLPLHGCRPAFHGSRCRRLYALRRLCGQTALAGTDL